MTPGLDAGPILGTRTTPIDPDETAGKLEDRLAKLGSELMLEVVNQLASGTAVGASQDKNQATKAPRLQKSDGQIVWSRSAHEIKNHVRGMHPWPRAFTFVPVGKGEPLRMAVDRVALTEGAGGPGEVLEADKRFIVATGEGAIELLEVQPAGKRLMRAEEWLRGTQIAVGQVLS